MFEDPKGLTSANWTDIHVWLVWFWTFAPLVLTFVLTMLTAHAIIPSLIITRHLPPSAARLRNPLTGLAFVLFVATLIVLILGIRQTLNIEKFSDRWLF